MRSFPGLRKILISIVVLGLFSFPASAAVKLPQLFSDHMVLQQNMRAAIWGWADPGESVTVSFRGQAVSSTADVKGKWKAYLEPLDAGGPFELKVAGKSTVTFKDVMVGEVWVCSGQSNMEMTVARTNNADQEIVGATNSKIRMFTVKHVVADEPQEDFIGSWEVTSPETVKAFSAVGYYFGRELQPDLNVPIGLIHSSWGGTPAESWASNPTLQSDLALQPYLYNWRKVMAEYPAARLRYERQLKEWEENSNKAKAENKPAPNRPAAPQGPGHPWTPSGLFNAMIAPMTSYAIRGAIWYQGESNAQPLRSLEYRRLFPGMIGDWRRAWDQGPFPFLFVQLANFMERKPDPTDSSWAELRESQSMTLGLPNTGMAVIIDIGEANDIHPRNKQDVGKRLALAARSVAYGQQIASSGPLYRGAKNEGWGIRIYFSNVHELAVKGGGKLEGFAIAGSDRKFVWADARIEGGTVVVSSKQVPNPVAVRYAWADNPACNLTSASGLPASPFRTDDWPQ